MLGSHLHARHSRVTIGVREMDIPRDKDILMICAAYRQISTLRIAI
jgi:hypothetical protein